LNSAIIFKGRKITKNVDVHENAKNRFFIALRETILTFGFKAEPGLTQFLLLEGRMPMYLQMMPNMISSAPPPIDHNLKSRYNLEVKKHPSILAGSFAAG
jgi:hypothetical protein